MKLTSLAAALLLLLGSAVLPACTNNVNIEKRPGVDLSHYRIFAWAETQVKTSGNQNPLLRSSIAEANIRQAIESELTGRRFRRAEENPDSYVTTHLFVEQAERTVANPPGPLGFGGFPYLVTYRGLLLPVNYGAWYSPAYYQTYRTERYRESTLVLDFIDARTNDLVWRGSIANPVNSPAKLGKQFARTAREVLEKFPAGRQPS